MNNRLLKKSLAAAIAAMGLASFSVQAYGPLYIHDYASGTPYRWDVTEPVQVWTDGGNFASGTVRLYNGDLDTCNSEGGWQCYEDVYVEFTNEQGVTRVAEALASWSAVPTSSFQAAVAEAVGKPGAPAVEVFAALRRRRFDFRWLGCTPPLRKRASCL